MFSRAAYFVLICYFPYLTACSSEEDSVPQLEAATSDPDIIGIWDASDTYPDGLVDVRYLEIRSATLFEYNYQGDTFDKSENCYVLVNERPLHPLGDNVYRLDPGEEQVPGEFGIKALVLSIVSLNNQLSVTAIDSDNGNGESTEDLLSTYDKIEGVSSVDFTLCQNPLGSEHNQSDIPDENLHGVSAPINETSTDNSKTIPLAGISYYTNRNALVDATKDDATAPGTNPVFLSSINPGDGLGGIFVYTDELGERIKLDPKGYHHLVTQGQAGFYRAIELDWKDDPYVELKRPRTKDFKDSNFLILGTSIPHQGIDTTSYMTIAVNKLGGSSKNMAWSGSSATPVIEPAGGWTGRGAPKFLGRSNRWIQEIIDAAGPDDGSHPFHESTDRATSPIQMGYEDRIVKSMTEAYAASRPFTHVYYGHDHNDRSRLLGNLKQPELAIASITKGVTTDITLETGMVAPELYGYITVYAAGMTGLDKYTGEVTSVNGQTITIDLDSTGVANDFTTGFLHNFDRFAFWPITTYLRNIIRWTDLRLGGDGDIQFIMQTAPSIWTTTSVNNDFEGKTPDANITRINTAIRVYAQAHNLYACDLERLLDFDKDDHTFEFSDGFHPMDEIARDRIANIIVQAWLGGTGI